MTTDIELVEELYQIIQDGINHKDEEWMNNFIKESIKEMIDIIKEYKQT